MAQSLFIDVYKRQDMQTRMRTEIVTNVRDSVLPFWMDYAVAPDGGFYGTVLRNGTPVAVSYTHLDVYKRQGYASCRLVLRLVRFLLLEP